jgi:hypothetical protein
MTHMNPLISIDTTGSRATVIVNSRKILNFPKIIYLQVFLIRIIISSVFYSKFLFKAHKRVPS